MPDPSGPELLLLLTKTLSDALGGQRAPVSGLELRWNPATGAHVTVELDDLEAKTA